MIMGLSFMGSFVVIWLGTDFSPLNKSSKDVHLNGGSVHSLDLILILLFCLTAFFPCSSAYPTHDSSLVELKSDLFFFPVQIDILYIFSQTVSGGGGGAKPTPMWQRQRADSSLPSLGFKCLMSELHCGYELALVRAVSVRSQENEMDD